ncbi:unnamed protein product [Candidula unifasciata]|uniref:L-serine deaminase n=1 Tax=Candidula unifasciata TaxID=100452 RepID=A0A8S3YTC8_9EUPU|nr:unnamed protein product [Candidula unifasciata]
MDIEADILTLGQIQEAYAYVRSSPDVVRTPLLAHVQDLFIETNTKKHEEGSSDDADGKSQLDISQIDLYMKMENMQTTGCFKIRGVVNQMRQLRTKHGQGCNLVTMSAGNYGKAFAHCVGRSDARCVCIMPTTAPQNRVTVIEGMGVQVKQVPTSDLEAEVSLLVKEGFVYSHSFNDLDLIAGHASSGLELLEDLPDPDVIVVNCGGGGFISGVAAAVSLSGVNNCRIYAVEPDGAATMSESFKAKRAMSLPHVKSVAAGLAPPYAGSLCYKHCLKFVEDVLLVSDEEILRATKKMFERGIKAEPSGSAALAAVLAGKVPYIQGKKVVVYVTGGNVTCEEMSQYLLLVS